MLKRSFLLASSNWNNGDKAGVTYLNSNNVATNRNRNISTQLELRPYKFSPEQAF